MNTKTQNALLVAGTSIATIAALGLSNAQSLAVSSTSTSNSPTSTSNQKDSTNKETRNFNGQMGQKNHKKGFEQFGGFEKGEIEGFRGPKFSDVAKTALTNGDYNAFKTAVASDKRLSNITQTQFDEMVAREKKMNAIQQAIKSNDYNAYVKATTPTQDEFNKLVARENSQTAIENAIKTNDYNAFLTAWKLDTSRPSDISVPTQDEFNKMVERYNKKSSK